MKYNPAIHTRKSIRIKEYDYSQSGYYFITICTHNREYLFGEIENIPVGVQSFEPLHSFPKILLNDAGFCAKKCLKEIPIHYPLANLDYFIVMPNHIHFIIIIDKSLNNVGVENVQPLQNQFQKIIPYSIGSIIKGFKIGVTNWFRNNSNYNIIWQRNYYEHIIRNDKELYLIRKYIENNPKEWDNDEYNKSKI